MYDLILFLVLLVLGYVFGQIAEKRHFRSIIERERELRDILCFTERNLPAMGEVGSALVCGNVVVLDRLLQEVCRRPAQSGRRPGRRIRITTRTRPA